MNNLYFEIVSPMRFDLTATPMSSCCIDEFFYFCTAQPRSPHDGSFADFDRGIVLGVARLAGQSRLTRNIFLAVSNDSLKHEPHLDLGDGTHDARDWYFAPYKSEGGVHARDHAGLMHDVLFWRGTSNQRHANGGGALHLPALHHGYGRARAWGEDWPLAIRRARAGGDGVDDGTQPFQRGLSMGANYADHRGIFLRLQRHDPA